MVEIYGVKGMKSVPFRKTFKTQAKFDAWLEKHGEGVTIHGYSSPETQWPTDGGGPTMADWRRNNPNPKHGCGHMQGRGAA